MFRFRIKRVHVVLQVVERRSQPFLPGRQSKPRKGWLVAAMKKAVVEGHLN